MSEIGVSGMKEISMEVSEEKGTSSAGEIKTTLSSGLEILDAPKAATTFIETVGPWGPQQLQKLNLELFLFIYLFNHFHHAYNTYKEPRCGTHNRARLQIKYALTEKYTDTNCINIKHYKKYKNPNCRNDKDKSLPQPIKKSK